MKKLLCYLSIAIAFQSLLGCDEVKNYVSEEAAKNPVTLVIGPAYKVKFLDGQIAFISGDDDCRGDTNSSLAGRHDCIVIPKERSSVDVHIFQKNTSFSEHWIIKQFVTKKGESATGFQRPNGEPVVAAL